MAISTYGIELHYKKKADAEGEFVKLYDIKDFPDLIGEPNSLETTTLSDGQQTFIPGIKQGETKAFTSNFTKEDFNTGKELEGQALVYKLVMGTSGMSFQWEGQHTMGLPGKGVDEVVEMTTNILASTEVTPVDEAAMTLQAKAAARTR